MNVEEEVEKLKVEIHRLGTKQPDGSYKVPFKLLPQNLHTSFLFCADLV